MKDDRIFGPVSKEKVIELYQDGAIADEDEVCAGNGYWFFIREQELLQRYLLGEEEQPFNPLSEAKVTQPSPSPGPAELELEQKPEAEPEVTEFPKAVEPEPKPHKGEWPSQGEPTPPASLPPKKQRDDRYLILLALILLVVLGFIGKRYIDIFRSFLLYLIVVLGGAVSYASQTPPTGSFQEGVVFRSDQGELVAKASINGIVFSLNPSSQGGECSFFEGGSFPMVWYLAEEAKSSDQCPTLSVEDVAISHLAQVSVQENSLAQVQRAVKIFGPKRSGQMVHIHRKKKQQQKAIIENLLRRVNGFLGAREKKPPEPAAVKQILSDLEQVSDHLLVQMAQMAVFHKLGNRGRSYVLFHSLLSRDRDFFLIANERFARVEDGKELERQLLALMKFLAKNFSSDEFRYLSLYLQYYWRGFIRRHFPVSLSLSEIRRLSRTFRWGLSYPVLWLEEFRGRSTRNDIQQYLGWVFGESHSPQLWRSHFWLFSFYTPVRQEVRHFIKQEAAKLLESPSVYNRFLLLKVLENRHLADLIKEHLGLKGHLVNLKRKVFREMIEQHHITNFALFHLLGIGDRNEDLLWWKIL